MYTSNNWKFKLVLLLLPIVGVAFLGSIAAIFLSKSDIYKLVESKLRSDLAIGYTLIDQLYPGPWVAKNGKLYKGDVLMNGNYMPVDLVSHLTGDTATIFLGDVRVTTSVRDETGKRLVGTRVAPAVAERVLKQGQNYYGRAKIVNRWYLTAYTPLRDTTGKVIGIWYVGVPLSQANTLVEKAALSIVVTGLVSVFFGTLLLLPLLRREHYLATHDPMTRLPNRYALERKLTKAISRAKRGQRSALLFMDIDNFKFINDAFGHSIGDRLLTAVAAALRKELRQQDFLARWGGDEFVVLVEVNGDVEAKAVAERLRQAVEGRDFHLSPPNYTFQLSLSIGLVMLNKESTTDPQKYLSAADIALFMAKEEGKNKVVCLTGLDDPASELNKINRTVALIKQALKENRFVLFLQPVVELSTGRVVHYEALIRLNGEDGALIAPGAFLPVAERFGLISQIDHWVINSVFNILQAHPGLTIFVNISGISLADNRLLEFVEAMLREKGVSPSRIGFEITETAALRNFTQAELWMRRLKALGCHIAIDDFGCGYSSFCYLRALPADYLKIDGSFVRDIDTNPTNRAIVEAMKTVAHALGKEAIAEFVENESVLAILQAYSVRYGQGYHLGRPAPLAEVLTASPQEKSSAT
ncbi:diguanylate cyclase (GGDEF)-like protein [Thermodesulfitimonas autotrophica]|uniref:Diguanylate cyclase (GGDEF)-like protein n=1 Tax=Thermodesulfitimonas autotrophica TaxID=1894989 RepID=A0A3N5AQ97_9THEO|nr:EAL domain-containing protein [Thermodesulfitimonas autotrophica]RPF47054.1 diguanylate cyclase (GGDEF)-like protein [Thermodesulfitimonas autotrophica]